MQTLTKFLRKVKHNAFNSFVKSYMFLCNKLHGVNQRKVVLKSFGGKSYSDNPKAISEKLHEIYPEAEIVWILKDPEKKKSIVPDYVRIVKANSLEEIKELATAKVWVDNFCKPLWTYKSREQFYIQTWHGDKPFKKILYDAWPDGRRPTPLIESEMCDLALSGSMFGEKLYLSAFRYSGKLIVNGCPRNDVLVNYDCSEANRIKENLSLDDKVKILLYAPTFRDSRIDDFQKVDELNLLETLSVLEESTKDHWICLVRAHSAARKGFDESSLKKGRILDVTQYEDMTDLMLISDLLITDYSSCAGDFALLGRPIILFQGDREEYLRKDRGLYFDTEISPFIVARSQEELLRIMKSLDNIDIAKNCNSILQFFGARETGKASETVAGLIVRELQ